MLFIVVTENLISGFADSSEQNILAYVFYHKRKIAILQLATFFVSRFFLVAVWFVFEVTLFFTDVSLCKSITTTFLFVIPNRNF